MAYVQYLIREYREVVERENEWARARHSLRNALLGALEESGRHRVDTEHGTAIRTTRVNLMPRRESVLALLKAEDLYPFTRFWPKQVQHVLVPSTDAIHCSTSSTLAPARCWWSRRRMGGRSAG